MSEPFLAEIRMVGFKFAPRGWAFCEGQILQINQNQSLFSLLGTMYGGDGRVSYGLPDMRGRAPMHVSTNYTQGRRSGVEGVTLRTAELPSHTHAVGVNNAAGTAATPVDNHLAKVSNAASVYASAALTAQMAPLQNAGGGQAHTNMQPYLAIHFIIALNGVFPSRS